MRFESESVDPPFPVVMGNEEETGMIVQIGDIIDEPYDMADNLPRYIPPQLMGSHEEYLINGFRVYVGGTEEMDRPTNVERATPECILPSDLTKYIRIGELIMDKIAENYARETSIEELDEVSVRLQRRVVDSQNNRKGCHDNFGIDRENDLANSTRLSPHVQQFVSSRLFMTGAGHIDQNQGVFYSQKVNGLVQIMGYGYMGTVGRMVPSMETVRMEIRSNDINISDWATKIRLGGMGILMALSETEELDQLNKFIRTHNERDFLARIKTLNEMYLMDSGTIEASNIQLKSVDYQQRVAELALKRLGVYCEVPLEYHKIAQEIYEFCDDYRAVVKGDKDLDILADRADWAAKIAAVRNSIEKDRGFGIRRDYLDVKSQSLDLKYDYREIKAIDGEIISRKEGFGYKLRDKGVFRQVVPENEVLKSFKVPPSDTRASLRGLLLSTEQVSRCEWSSISFYDNKDEKRPHEISFAPRDTFLSEDDESKLKTEQFKTI